MKNLLHRPNLRGLAAALAVTTLSGYVAQAHPYASGITNNGGTISFILNENADNVGLSFPDNHSTNNLGALTAGVHSFTLGAGTNAYVIYVSKAGSGTPSLISPVPVLGGNTNLAFFGPRGVTVNKNPKGSNFGRIYVANASPGSFVGRFVGKGLYIMNADYSDALGLGTNASPALASFPGGGAQTWGASTANAPWRLWVGSDDTVYASDTSGTGTINATPVWMMDPNLTTPIEMFSYTTYPNGNAGPCQSEPVITGSLGTGDLTLTCMMWYYNINGATYQSILQYPIGAGPINSGTVWSGNPTIIVTNAQPGFGAGGVNSVTEDVTVNPTNSYVYYSCNRATDNVNNQIAVFNGTQASPVGTNYLWASRDPSPGGGGTINNGTNNDCFYLAGIQPIGIAISPDGQYLAMGNNIAANFAYVRLTNGIPDKSTITKVAVAGVINRAVAFDAADNLYTVEGNSDSLRCYSLGLTTTCVTSNDLTAAHGSFRVILPASSVTVAATTPNASQGNPTPTPGVFTITRAGQLTAPLYVNFSLGGTASNSTYTVSGAVANTNITFAIGQSTTNVTITPVHDNIARLTTTVTISLNSGSNYTALSPLQATILIQNTATPQLIITNVAATAYKRYTNDYASVSITRLGNTNTALSVNTLAFGGTAVQNTDYALLNSSISIPAGTITTTATKILSPLNPPEPTYAGDKTVVVTVGNGSGYVGTAGNSAVLTILDDKYPPAPVLFSDPLTDPNDNTNWNLTYQSSTAGAGPDYTVDWGYDLTTDPNGYGMIPLPPNGLTSVLRATYNKTFGVSGAVNLYETNAVFGGDYAVRFQMYLAQGGEFGAVGNGVATEGCLFGINHDGMETNWFAGSTPTATGPWTADGNWFWLDADPGGASAGDYIAFTGISNAIPNSGWAKPVPALFTTSFLTAFKNPETFTTVGVTTNPVPGLPANASFAVVPTNNANWADVEIKQVKNVVTLSINKTVIFSYPNTNTLFQSGMVMLGYEDPFNSLGNPDAAVYFSGLQVVRLLNQPVITSIVNSGPNVVIQFTSNDGDASTSSFTLQSSSVVTGPYTDVSPAASITLLAPGVYQAVYAQSGPAQFYRIKHN